VSQSFRLKLSTGAVDVLHGGGCEVDLQSQHLTRAMYYPGIGNLFARRLVGQNPEGSGSLTAQTLKACAPSS